MKAEILLLLRAAPLSDELQSGFSTLAEKGPKRVNPLFILRAFQRGADGVILCGCHPGDCHYTTGNYYARRRMTLLFSMLDFLGIERERTRVEWVSAAEGAKFAKTMNEFAETITKLGENRRLEDLRCKE